MSLRLALSRRLQPPVSSSAGIQRSFLGHPVWPALVPRQELLKVFVQRVIKLVTGHSFVGDAMFHHASMVLTEVRSDP